jgi:hypothetical protein
MDVLGRSPFCWLEFNENGELIDENAASLVAAMLAQGGIGDLVVISHGWKNTKSDAKTLYGTLWNNTCAALTQGDPAKIAVCGILWPAKAYSTDFDDAAASAGAHGQTLAAGTGVEPRDLTDAEFAAALADFREVFGSRADATIDAANKAANAAEIDDANADQLFASARIATAAGAISPKDSELRKDAERILSPGSPQDILIGLASPPAIPAAPGLGGTRDLDDVVGGLLHGTRAAVARFLNQLTYFEMKKRAGLVGATLGSSVFPHLKPRHEVRLHLIGHSFGGRLVTAAASNLPNNMDLPFFSLTLLQAAFSHNALAQVVEPGTPGAFANVIGRPIGPISITHTHNDRACTFWYALASRLSRDVTAGLGDKDDIFGAMGANGAQKLTANVIAPDHSGQNFAPQRGKVNGFLADSYIVKTNDCDAHNNVANSTVGRLVAAVLRS